ARTAGRGNAEPARLPLLIFALAVARAVFVARHRAEYASVLTMIDIRDRGFDSWAGWAAAAAGVGLWAWRRPALRLSLPLSASAGAAIVLAGMGALALLQPARPPLPDLTLQTLQGRPVALASLRGRPLVVNLWATWCPPCRRELPLLIRAAQQQTGARIVLVNEGETAQRVAAYLQRERLGDPGVLLDPGSRLLAAYQSPGLPTTLFIAADGRVQRVHIGELSAATLQQGIAALNKSSGD
ncbi:MAG: TlpA family protein disulfide reductase, partial [Thiomonas sp.]